MKRKGIWRLVDERFWQGDKSWHEKLVCGHWVQILAAKPKAEYRFCRECAKEAK